MTLEIKKKHDSLRYIRIGINHFGDKYVMRNMYGRKFLQILSYINHCLLQFGFVNVWQWISIGIFQHKRDIISVILSTYNYYLFLK